MKFNEAISYDPSLDWDALLQFATGERARFEPLWHSLIEKGVEEFRWLPARGYAGEVISFKIPNGPIDQVYVWARSKRGKFPTGADVLPPERIAVQFRYRKGLEQSLKEDHQQHHNGYLAIASPQKTDSQDSTHLYIGVRDWHKDQSLVARSDAIMKTWLASLFMFKQLTGIELPGVRYEQL